MMLPTLLVLVWSPVRKPVEEELVRGYHEGLFGGRAGLFVGGLLVGLSTWCLCRLCGHRHRSMLVQRTIVAIPCLPPWRAATRDTPLISGSGSFCASDNCLFSEYRPTPCVPLDPDPLPVCFHHRTSSLPGSSDRIWPAGLTCLDEVAPDFMHGVCHRLRCGPRAEKEIHASLIEIVEGEGSPVSGWPQSAVHGT